VRILVAALVIQIVLGATVVALAATHSLPFQQKPEFSGERAPAGAAKLKAQRFDERAAYRWVKRQVALGPRPAGSAASRKLAGMLRRALPHGRFEAVPGGLRNVIGTVRGRDPRSVVVVGAHYDTLDKPGFVGANDGAAPTAVVLELARGLKPREARPTVVFALFDGEEAPAGTPDSQFLERGVRGSRVAARRYRHAEAMILLDFVGQRDVTLPREGNSDPALWQKLRAAARRVGAGSSFPDRPGPFIQDDHIPFLRAGVPAIDLIDWDFPCYHRTCDDLSVVSQRSLDRVGESVAQLVRTL
jgi:hypothetical protein